MFREINIDFQDYIYMVKMWIPLHESSSQFILHTRKQIAYNHAYEVPYYRYQSRHFIYDVDLCTFQECHDCNDS